MGDCRCRYLACVLAAAEPSSAQTYQVRQESRRLHRNDVRIAGAGAFAIQGDPLATCIKDRLFRSSPTFAC
jgi:hypothetical protein